MKSLAIVIPAYNEEDSILNVIESVSEIKNKVDVNIETIIVNDCSTDKTSLLAEKCDCITINLPTNLGIGGAVQTGFIYAYKMGFDYAMQMDGDGQHPADQIEKFLKKINNDDVDVVIGSRFIEKKGFQSSIQRRLGIKYLNKIINLFTKLTITDCTSGFRLLNRKALEIVVDNYPDEYPEPESIILYHKNGLKISETPVVMKDRSGGKSSIRSFNTIYYMIKVSLAIIISYIKK